MEPRFSDLRLTFRVELRYRGKVHVYPHCYGFETVDYETRVRIELEDGTAVLFPWDDVSEVLIDIGGGK